MLDSLPPVKSSWLKVARSLPPEISEQLLKDMPPELEGDWELLARREQLPPSSDWTTWLLMAGRGVGKTRTGAEWIHEKIRRGANWVALVGPTAADARDVMIEGQSGLLACARPEERPIYEPTKRRLTWPNGATATAFSADEPERLRGPQHEVAWCDEIGAWRYADAAWSMLMLGLRLGPRPQVVATTTPRSIKLIKKLVKRSQDDDSGIIITQGSTYDNLENLSPAFAKAIISEFEGTRLAKQEIEGKLLEEFAGALWSLDKLSQLRIRLKELPKRTRTVIAVDPPIKESSEESMAGISVAGKGEDGLGYVLQDASLHGSPADWASAAVKLFYHYEADAIVAEVNQGGDMVEHTIHSVDPDVKVIQVHASKGKALRAEPISAHYDRNNVRHVGVFTELEDEMCTFVPGESKWSPNRLDALVWALTELLIGTGKRAGIWGRRAGYA